MSGVPRDALEPVLAHELVHALQDQHVDLDSLVSRERGNDRQTAAQAALKGHATLVMVALVAERQARRPVSPDMLPDLKRELGPALEAENERFPVFRSAPRICGRRCCSRTSRARRSCRRCGARIRPAAGRRRSASLLPQLTEQVMHPRERFIQARDEPTELRLGAVSGRGRGRGLAARVREHPRRAGDGDPAERAPRRGCRERAAQGWDGDRDRLLEAPDGGRALVWYSARDTTEAADRFASAYRRILEVRAGARRGRVERLEVEGRPGRPRRGCGAGRRPGVCAGSRALWVSLGVWGG